MASKRKTRKVRKFKQVNFKLTYQQKKRVDAFCRKHKTTPVNMYKKAILLYLSNNGYGAHRQAEPSISEKQMSIFDFVEDPSIQQYGS
ncbi:MAG: hypothetical protein CVU14_06010 [Bacteroidetes bacterium HGW-Bacteroidetes-9]|jgi:CO dehydrogenase/acetyl-CoA synthase alpha subunit|nr:MAG: hypothetical protein CVU14_06010 [Bacteroidetes bacterium HGW-Bacteroidetes-9]